MISASPLWLLPVHEQAQAGSCNPSQSHSVRKQLWLWATNTHCASPNSRRCMRYAYIYSCWLFLGSCMCLPAYTSFGKLAGPMWQCSDSAAYQSSYTETGLNHAGASLLLCVCRTSGRTAPRHTTAGHSGLCTVYTASSYASRADSSCMYASTRFFVAQDSAQARELSGTCQGVCQLLGENPGTC